MGFDVGGNGRERRSRGMKKRERGRCLAARLGCSAGGALAVTGEARIVLDPNAGVPVRARRERAVARKDAFGRHSRERARQILVVVQARGREDSKEENPGDGADP